MAHSEIDNLLSGIDCDFGADGLDLEPEATPAAARKHAEKPARKLPREAAGIETSALTVRGRRTKSRCLDLRRVKAAADQIGSLPDEGEALHCIMGGDFNGWEIVPAVLDLAGAAAEVVYITTLGFNLENNTQLCAMLDAGRILAASVPCSEYFARTDPNVYNASRAALEQRGQRLKCARNHSKIILAACAGRFFVVESSANLRTCNNIEQFTLFQSREVFDFHRAWIDEVFDHEARA